MSSPSRLPKASNASMTQLPPSPELKSMHHPHHQLQQHNPQFPVMPPNEFSLLATTTSPGVSVNMPPTSTSTTPPTRRLRSVARYQAFHPQALACSDILTSSLNEEETAASSSSSSTNLTTTNTSTATTNNHRKAASKDPGPSSLGAVAGTQGVALFRLSRPHVPLLILSHATTTTSSSSSSSSRSSVSSMAFQPTLATTTTTTSNGGSHNNAAPPPQSLYLAATRGSGVLIWDASGHTPNPLVGRLGMDQVQNSSRFQQYGTPDPYYYNNDVGGGGDNTTTTSESDDFGRIISLAWKPCTTTPLLGTATSSSLSLWDLRSGASHAIFKPNLRFGTARRTVSPLVQAAFSSSDNNECATMDSAGVVRIYDIRMSDRSRSYMGSPTSTFVAHATAGVGIAYFPECRNREKDTSKHQARTTTNTNNSRWLTWGLDAPFSSTVVKVWSKDESSSSSSSSLSKQQAALTAAGAATIADVDDYWNMSDSISQGGGGGGGQQHHQQGGSSSRTSVSLMTQQPTYKLTAQCVRPNLACARVGASPVENSFVAIGHVASDPADGPGGHGGWWAELYTITDNDDKNNDADEKEKSTSTLSTYGMKKIAGFQGGTSKNSGDKNALLSVLGSKVGLGNLTAAELGFSGTPLSMPIQSPQPFLTDALAADRKDDDAAGAAAANRVELLLCCMSDTGVVTTHVIPEAIPRTNDHQRVYDSGRRDGSPKSGVGSRAVAVRTAFPASNQTRVYPEDREGSSFFDAAGFWDGTSKQSADAAKIRMEEARARLEQLQPAPLYSPENEDPPTSLAGRRDADGGLMPFDMDVPVAYGSVATSGVKNNIQLGITDMASGTVVSSTGIGVVEESKTVAADALDSTIIMENIETERVPCPRLCGATFGMGAGGLVVFHNGEVKKMWNWYQRSDTLRLTGVLGSKTENPATDLDNFRGVNPTTVPRTTSNPLSPRVEESAQQNQPDTDAGPRTLKELVNMMATAKEAQWGDHALSDDSDSQGGVSAGDNFFEDESLDSNSSDSGDDGPLTPPPGHEMYERYFGGRAWKGTIAKAESSGSPSRIQSTASSLANAKVRSTYGPSSDMLAPVVSVSHELNATVLNHQSVALALGWELGSWDVARTFYQPDMLSDNEYDPNLDTSSDDAEESLVGRKGLPHYRYLVPSPGRRPSSLPRPKSDPSLFQPSQPKSKPGRIPHDEPGVHGGEYTVRPNMEESMTFLKKLFSHQQEGGRSLRPLMSPPDSPSLFNNFSKAKRPSSAEDIGMSQTARYSTPDEVATKSSPAGSVRLGVHTIVEQKTSEDDEVMEQLENIKRICLHNATVCENLGVNEKEGVWKLLAQTVDNQIDAEGKLFNGWGGTGGGALGVDLVANLLEYYENLRDVQMLATIFCVLSGGRRGTGAENQPHLLPRGDDVCAKYDAYIKKYAELLYSWGLLSVRAELNKHLLRVPPRREGVASMEEQTETGRSPGIAVVFNCPTCGRDADFNTNICRTCQDFAFRCSICDNAIRGLFTVCDVCNHGGHVDHMKSWFSNHVECPTGCGCTCSFSSFLPKSGELSVEYD